MITRQELIEYAGSRNLNLGQGELDYMQKIILFILSKQGRKIIFKGGTALSKAYNLDRFSEDLDFSVNEEFNIKETIEELVKALERSGINCEIKGEKHSKDSVKFTLRIQGPLYTNTPASYCKVNIDFSLREKILLEPDLIKISHILAEVPLFTVFVMNLKEIVAEKVRAVVTRTKARDVYDLDYLFRRGVEFDEKLANKKLEYYHMSWDKKQFLIKVKEKENIWERELKHLIPIVSSFKECYGTIKKSVW